jgi:HK97 family phage major capsid protein/HK97 family phage prohead protease
MDVAFKFAHGFKGVDPKRRTVHHAITTRAVDRDGDVVLPQGGRFEDYRKNPVVFFNHGASQAPIGRCLSLAVNDDDVTAVTLFADHEEADRIYRLIKDGFLRAWSMGFLIAETSREKVFPHQSGRTISAWSLLEYSSVGIPSNPEALVRFVKATGLPEGATDADLYEVIAARRRKFWNSAGVSRQHEGVEDMEIQQYADAQLVAALAAVDAELQKRGLDSSGRPQIVDIKGQRFPLGQSEAKQPQPGAPAVIHSRGEQGYYFMNATKALAHRDWSRAPYEKSMHDRLTAIGYAAAPNSISAPLDPDRLVLMPGHEQETERLVVELKQALVLRGGLDEEEWRAAQRTLMKAMSSLDDTVGGSLVPLPSTGALVEMLRAAQVFEQAGAPIVPLAPQGTTQLPRATSDPVFIWLGDNASIPESDPGTGSLTLAAKRLGGLVHLPNDLLRYSLGIAEMMVRQGLSEGIARAEELAFLESEGGSNKPLGVIRYDRSADDTPTPNKVTLHNAGVVDTNGDTFQPEDAALMQALVEEAPDPQGATAFVMRPLMLATLANRRADAVSANDGKGPFLFNITRDALGGPTPRRLFNGLPVAVSTLVNRTSRKGSASNLTFIIAGNFRRCYIGRVGTVELALSEHVAFSQDAVKLRAVSRSDMGLARPESFVICPTLLVQ